MTTATKKAAATAKDNSSEGSKRKMLTPAERIAKAEADLARLREAAEAKGKKRISALLDQRAVHVKHIDERTDKVKAIDLELDSLGYVPQPALSSELQPTG